MKRIISLVIFSMLILACFSINTVYAARQTRDLVFEDEAAPPKPAPAAPNAVPEPDKQAVVAIKTTIDLDRGGQKTNVLPDYEFKSGDKVKIIYTTNIDCFVYWLSQGTSGQYVMLFPNAKTGADNWITKNKEQIIPVSGTFKFDETPGVEKILLVMSPVKVPELEQAAKEAMVKGGKLDASSGNVGAVVASNQSKRQTRDLVFEEDENKTTGVETSIQKSSDIKQVFVNYYELKHK